MINCMECKMELPVYLDYVITGKNGTFHYCPNCITKKLYDTATLDVEEYPYFVCEITGNKGAIKFQSVDEVYYLNKNAMIRLISHSLFPDEYLTLMKTRKGTEYMIHDDFYTEDGIAIQPLFG